MVEYGLQLDQPQLCRDLERAAISIKDFDQTNANSVAEYQRVSGCVEHCSGEQAKDVGQLATFFGFQDQPSCPFQFNRREARTIVEERLSQANALQTP